MILGLSLVAQAQRGKGYQGQNDFTPEQRAELKTKKMALHLDLNKEQQDKLLKVNRSWAEKRAQAKEKFKAQMDGDQKPDADARYAMRIQMMDNQMAYQSEIKKILNEEQYATWKEHRSKQGDRGRHGNRTPCKRSKDDKRS